MAPTALTLLILLSMAAPAMASLPTPTARERQDILQLGARLNSLERELGRSNDKYIAALEKIRALETEAQEIEGKLVSARETASRREVELAQILRSYHLAVVEGDAVPEPRYRELVKANRAKAAAAVEESAALEKLVGEYRVRLDQLRKDEQDLVRLASDLEVRKQALSESYLKKLSERQRREHRRDNQKIATKLREANAPVVPEAMIPPDLRFGLPLEQVSAVSPSEKGVTLSFNRLQALRAPRAGRVVYNGELASYGKVLMIDHGGDIRTVLLGRFRSPLQKNAQVAEGDTLGYTDQDTDTLYFEVRKKNVAQKTIHWLAPGAVGRI